MKILMVCLGNICRSPLAEGLMREKIHSAGLDWTVDSAGTSGWHSGEAPDRRSVQIARANQIDISHQRARQFSRADFNRYDLIFAMDKSNLNELRELASTEAQRKKVKLFLAEIGDMPFEEVPDPYYDGNFQRVFDMLDTASDRFVQKYTGNS